MRQASVRALRPEDYANPHPVYVVWELTLRCDQACRHCGSRAGLSRRSELTTDEALDVVDQLASMRVREVTLIGGESYLRADWLAIARALHDRDVRVSVVTGGRAMTPERARAAQQAGVRSISVSIDGLAATHDALRAVPNGHAGALRALDAIRDAGVLPTVNTQINTQNRNELEGMARMIAARGARAWQLQLTTPMGRAADQSELVLQPWQLLDVIPRLARIAAAYRPRGLDVTIANNLGYFGPHENDLRAGGHFIGCTAGKWSLGIQSDGVIKGCSSLPEGPFGDMSVRTARLADIVARSAALEALRSHGTDELSGFCASCYYASVCRGGCTWVAHTLLGRPGNMPYCYHRAETLRARGVRERVAPVSAAPGTPFDRGEWEVVEEPWRSTK